MSTHKRCAEWLQSIEPSLPPVLAHDGASPQDSVLEAPLRRRRARMDDHEAAPRQPEAKRVRPAGADGQADMDVDDESRSYATSKRSRTSQSRSKASSSLARQTNRLKAGGRYDERPLCDLDNAALPESLVRLRSDLAKLADGTGTLPRSLQQRLEHTGNINSSRADLFYDDQGAMGVFWEQIQGIVKQANRCRVRKDYEAGWNSAVHHSVLNLACQISGYDEHVWAVNISPVRPQQGLLPSGREIRKKMVDFGLVLNTRGPGDKLAQFYHSPAFPPSQSRESFTTWNHTEGQLIAEHPLVVSIETKRQAEKDGEADLQLGTWGSAHLQRLVELRAASNLRQPASIFLPQIKVQGAHFTLMLVRGDYDGATDSLKVVLYTGEMMGDVTTYNGLFRVLACVRRIVVWAHLSYRPWLQEWVGAD